MIGPIPAIAPSPGVAVVLQAAGIGALFGTIVAARRRASNPNADTWLLTVRWSVAGAILGLLAVLADALGLW